MRDRVVGNFLLTLGLLLVVAVGGVVGDTQQTPVAERLHDADGKAEAIVTFDEMEACFEPGDEITFSVEPWDYGDIEEGATTVEVPDEPVISLVSITAPTQIEAGETFEVDYVLENIGAEPGTESAVNLLVEDELEDTDEAVEVPAEGTAEGTLTFEDTGELLAFVEAADAELSESTAFDGPTIDGDLRHASGEERVLVALDTAADDIEGLQDAVETAAEPVVEFAEATRTAEVVQVSWLAETVSLDVDLDTVDVAALADIGSVEHVTTSPTFEAHEAVESAPRDGVVRDSEYTYGLEQVNAPETWATHGTQGEGVSVAVLDTGVDDDHPDLTVDEWAHFDGDGDPVDSEPQDGNGHGTHVAGTVVGPTDPAGDVPGYSVAPAADLHGVKVLGDTGGGSFEQIIAGMEWAVEDGDSDIISMSLGATGYVPEMVAPVTNAVEAGVPVVSSAGNSGDGSSGSPGNVYDAISVGASDETEGIAGFSSGGVIDTDSAWNDPPGHWPGEYTVPSVAAPGVDVLSSVPGGGYDDTYSGTSMAAPHVSGVVALAMSAADEELSPTLIEQTLESTAFKPDDAPAPPGERDTRYGSGIVDALGAVDGLSDPPEGELVEFTVEAVDAGDSLGGEVFVEEPDDEPPEEPELVITDVDAPAEIELDDDLAVDYEVENVGDETGDDFVDLFVDAEESFVDFDSIEVDPGETVDGTLTFEEVAEFYEQGETIEWSVELLSFDDVADGETEIAGEPPGEAEFEIQNVDLTTPVAGEDLDALVTVENVGDDADTQTVELDVGGLGADATDLELDAGETGEAELAVGTEVGDDGEYDATVTTEDDEASAPVLVLAPASFSSRFSTTPTRS